MAAIAAISPMMSTAVFAQPSDNFGIETGDENVHTHALNADIVFHEGLCQAGISTDALGDDGCDNPVLSPAPGESADVRQDN